jgi:thiol peroxidase
MKRILSRSTFVIGPDGTLKYVEYVPDISSEPDYDAVFAATV